MLVLRKHGAFRIYNHLNNGYTNQTRFGNPTIGNRIGKQLGEIFIVNKSRSGKRFGIDQKEGFEEEKDEIG